MLVSRKRLTLIDSAAFSLERGGVVHLFIDYSRNKRVGLVLHVVVTSPDKCHHHYWKYKDDSLMCDAHFACLRRKFERIGTPI